MTENKFKCNVCSKYYKSYQSLWNHNKKFHQQIPTIHPQNNNNIPTIYQQNIHIQKIKKTEQSTCIYCNKEYSCYNSMNRHVQTCKTKQHIIKENEELKIKTQIQQEQILNIEKKLDNINNKMNKIINSPSKSITNNTNNGTINNNINIYNFGYEKVLENLPKEKILEILRKHKYGVLLSAIETTHFDKEHPEGHNWFISNFRENFALVLDDKLGKTIRENKDETVDFVINQRICEIEELGNIHKKYLNEVQVYNIDNIVKNDYPPDVFDKVKTMAYEKNKIVIDTHKNIHSFNKIE